MILQSDLISMRLLISETQYHFYVEERGIPLQYTSEVFVGFYLIILPFVVGLWSVGWLYEDLGLMHYKLPDENKKSLFEIEPIHLKYNNILKGYAGISAIFYYIGLIVFYFSFPSSYSADYIFPLIVIYCTFAILPSYFIYWKILKKLFKKRLKWTQIKILKESDIL